MLVLGVDPGTATTGFGLVRFDSGALQAVSFGTLTTPAGLPLPQRLQLLYRDATKLLAAHRPTEAAVEELFFARNARTALAVGHARGVLLLALADAGLTVHEYTPMQVKQAITGYGRASKEQMQAMVRLLLSLEEVPRPDDVGDALALAICHVHFSSTARALSASGAGGGT